jgi:CRISPR-associated protein Cas5t
MQVLKVVAEGFTTSFRYPHFMQGVHPSFEMPPPATIYGHICSTLGEWIPPEGIEFAYHFTYSSQFEDVEHVHVLTASTGKLPGVDLPKILAGNVNPFKRFILFKPRLILYLNKPEWEQAFRSPRYAVILGRSQDLFTYTSISCIELIRDKRAYFEHTLAPYRTVLQTGRGLAVVMPRYLDYFKNRTPYFARYVILRQRVYCDYFIRYNNQTGEFLVDPTLSQDKGAHLGLFFHTFTGDYDDACGMA